jgi:hypothetical protein
MTRILLVLLATLALPGCSTLPERVVHTSFNEDSWHGYVDWGRGFTVEAPGRLAIRPDDDGTGQVLEARSYTTERGTLRFSILAVPNDLRRPPSSRVGDEFFDLFFWEDLGGVWPSFQRHVYLDGRLYRQRLVFADRMIYELIVSGPADVFPDFAARRFFDSFTVMVKT